MPTEYTALDMGKALVREAGLSILTSEQEAQYAEAIESLRKEIVRLEAERDRVLAAVMELSRDMHCASKRPCSTCQKVTMALMKPFGCDARRIGH